MRKLLVSFFGLGFGPAAPGTWASLGAVAVFLALHLTLPAGLPWWAILAGVVLASAACVALSPWAIATYRSKDPRPMVLDEVAGQWLGLLFVPLGAGWRAVWVVGAAFALFRVFDVLKPPPARQLERLSAGWGILCDDLAAGVMTNVVLQLALYFFWRS